MPELVRDGPRHLVSRDVDGNFDRGGAEDVRLARDLDVGSEARRPALLAGGELAPSMRDVLGQGVERIDRAQPDNLHGRDPEVFADQVSRAEGELAITRSDRERR